MKSIKLNNLEELAEIIENKEKPKKKKKVAHVTPTPVRAGKRRRLDIKGGLKIFRNS